MPRLPRCTGDEAVRAFERLGGTVVRQRGSHVVLRMPNRSLLSVPVHVGRTLGPGLLRSLLRDAEVEVEAFRNAL